MQNVAPSARPTIAAGGLAPEDTFRAAEKAFALAVANAGGTRELFIGLADLTICLRCAGGTLLDRIGPTLAHLEVEGGSPVDFTISCWDCKATGSPPPLPAPRVLDRVAFGCLKLLTDHRFRAFYIHWAGIFCSMDMGSNNAYCCYEDAESLLMYEVAGPLRSVFGAVLNRQGMQLVHAAAVGTARGSLLFAGPPGSGKSTLSILCLQAGLCYQSDDLCVLTSEPRPRSLSLYNIAKLREDAFPRFKALHPILSHFEEGDEKKAYFHVHRHFPGRVLKQAPVRALVLPSIGGEPASRLERASPMEAVRALIAWSVKEIPKSDSLGERIMLQAVSRLPAHRLHLGRDDESTLTLIRSLLDER